MKNFCLGCMALLALAPAGVEFSAAAEDAAAVHRNTLTLDSHIDLPREWATPALDPGKPTDHQADLVKMEEGGLKAAFFIAYTGQNERTPQGLDEARREAFGKLLAIHRMADRYPDRVAIAYKADDVPRIADSGRIAALIGMENGFPIGDDLDWVRFAYEGGVRYITLTHNGHNQLGDSATPLPRLGDGETLHGGLSNFGREAIAEMNRLGIMVDISHTAESTTLDAAEASKAPVIASHSAVKALADVPRNLSDKGLQAVAATGGVVQIVAFDPYIRKDGPEEEEERRAARDKFDQDQDRDAYTAATKALDARYGRATVEEFVDHIDYAVKLIGVDHVGISSDFGGGGGVVGWDSAAETPNVTAELVKRGYSAEDVAKIWSGNMLRVMRAVEEVAAGMPAAEEETSGRSDIEAIRDVLAQELDILITGEVDGFDAITAGDSVYLPPDGPALRGTDAIKAWHGDAKRFDVDMSHHTEEIAIIGDWAFETWTAEWTAVPLAGGAAISDRLQGVHIFRKQADDSWIIYRDVWNSSVPRLR